MPVRSLQPILLLFLVALPIQPPVCAEILFSHCLGPVDLGGFEKEGNIQNSCIRDHHFYNESHPWILRDSSITRTNFTNCTFHNTVDLEQSFNNTQWEDVIFRDCTFASVNGTPSSPASVASASIIRFTHVYFYQVQFINCTFEQPADVIFQSFAFRIVTFESCTVLGRLIGLEGDMWNVKIHQSLFGTGENRTTENTRNSGDTLFAYVNLQNIKFHHNSGSTNALMVASAAIEALEVAFCRMGSFRCSILPEAIATSATCSASGGTCGQQLMPAFMNDTIIRNSTLVHGVDCQGATALQFFMRNITLGGVIDFSESNVSRLTIDTVLPLTNTYLNSTHTASSTDVINALNGTNGTNSTNSTNSTNGANGTDSTTIIVAPFTEVRLVDSVISSGRRIAHVDTTNITLTGATFRDAISFIGFKLSDGRVESRDATFSQEMIGGECCSIACDVRGCICDFGHDPVFCPISNGTARSSKAGSGACFPGSSMLWVWNGEGANFGVRPTRMDRVRVGDVAAAGIGTEMKHGSRVFFFGHRDLFSVGMYVAISATVYTKCGDPSRNLTLRVSGGHYVYVRSKGLQPARLIRHRDVVYTVWGAATVTSISGAAGVGMYAPVTTTGDMIVDGVFVSCFTEVMDSVTATALLSPLRWLYVVGGEAGRFIVSQIRLLDVWSGAELVSSVRRAMACVI